LNVDPEFAAVGTDYRLAAGSPLIDVGMAIPGVNDDFFGEAPDIGAYEYGAQSGIHQGRKASAGPGRMPAITVTRSLTGGATLRIDCGALADPTATLGLYSPSGKRFGLFHLHAGVNWIATRIDSVNPSLGFAVMLRDGKRYAAPLVRLP
jgi:hypothetical protein